MKHALALDKLPREEALHAMLGSLVLRWRLFILLPMVYLLAGIYVQGRWLDQGLLPLSPPVYFVLLFAAGFVLIILWRFLLVLQRRHTVELMSLREDANEFFRRARELQMLRFAVCDLAAVPGILLFLLNADPVPLMIFCLCSMVFYLKAHPSAFWLGVAFLRPDLLKE